MPIAVTSTIFARFLRFWGNSSDTMSGRNAPNYRILIERFNSSSQWERTLETAREWLSVEPENSQAHMAAGQALVYTGRHSEAERHIAMVLAAQPDNDIAHRHMSAIQFASGRYKAADESVRKAISLDTNNAYHWYHLAWMCYRQGDRASAKKYCSHSLELNPRNSVFLHLAILCEPVDRSNVEEILAQFEKALELDPTDAFVHNSIGACHLDVTHNYQAAEESFRRALFFSPSHPYARKNLFILLKNRDRIYRALHAPRDFFVGDFSFMIPKDYEYSDNPFLDLYVWALPDLMIAIRYNGIALWYIFVWPLVKAYEYLTIGDIRSKAGEVGAKSGGLAGYRRWSLLTRLGIFAALPATFWGGAALFWLKKYVPSAEHPRITLLGVCLCFGLIAYLVGKIRQTIRTIRKRRVESEARSRAKKIKVPLTEAEIEYVKWRSHQLWLDWDA
jgi:tetratricopeptide (TPR) repeat protein